MRNRLLEVLHEEYVVAARGRGYPERMVIVKHAVRNALIPIITIYGLSLLFLLGAPPSSSRSSPGRGWAGSPWKRWAPTSSVAI